MENQTILDGFHRIVNQYEDTRIKDWFLMQSPIPTLAVSLVYIIAVTILLPSYMKNRKPYQLQNFVVYYSGFQVLFSSWIVYEFLAGGWYNFQYNKCLLAGPGDSMRIVAATYWYFISKFTEFMDTILFVLRKKDNQITTLHLYHHGSMPIGAWLCVKYGPDGAMTFLGLLNSCVHIIMYSYYTLSAMGPKIQKYLWWKKYLTMFQLVQFVMTLSQSIASLVYGCGLPIGLSLFNITQSVTFFVMFFDFYLQSYKKKSDKAQSPDKGVAKKIQ